MGSVRRPSPDSLAAAEAVAKRNRSRAAQVRRLLIERPDVSRPTPLARLLRGGRGGSVRLKLYLSMIWLASAPPHDVAYPARAWATLLDLPDPDKAGARRVNDSVAWLEAHDFVTVETVPGHPNRVTLLDESGTGRRYLVPGAAYNRARQKKADAGQMERHRYVQLPSDFWTSGWLATLSGPAVAMLLVLLAERSSDAADQDLWFSPGVADKRYSLSEDTRSAGLNELRRASLIVVRRKPISNDVFDFRRFRNVYQFDPSALSRPAEVPEKRNAEAEASVLKEVPAVPARRRLRKQ